MRLHQRFKSFDFHPKLTLVVHRATRVDVVVAFSRLEGRRNPLVERIRRLHIEVRIHQHGGRTRGVEPIRVKQRMPLGRDDFNVLHADASQFAGHEVGRFLHVRFVFFQSADAGNAEKVFQLAYETLLVLTSKIKCRGGHEEYLSCANTQWNERRWTLKRISITELQRRRCDVRTGPF